ncbi:hypothetical protein LPJ61_004186 [Coemansia biformis]|uniref:THO complex subunit 1 n=1 Tax=Coemansia biformis TaxID=1286918 RepID=A0A9W7Y947_9FUNG|nr:hypothetical protein LPJ61_004186 [Coemansia biformis]
MNSSATEYGPLIARAVGVVLASGLISMPDLDIPSLERCIGDISALLSQAGDVGKRDFEYAMHTYIFDLTQKVPTDAAPMAAQDMATDGSEALCQIIAAVDIAMHYSDIGLTDASFAFTLLEETMDMVSVGAASEIFAHVERRAAILRRGITATGGKGVIMLKMCNSLLRRIPHSTRSEFAGRVQIFVANSFPLSERSGVNLRGDFDRSNLPQLAEDVGGEDEGVYRAFWSLQEYFASPQLLTATEGSGDSGGFAGFAKAASLAMDEFRKTTTSKSLSLAVNPTGSETLKHLTLPALLRMQFGDPQFKCQVLLQLLIFIKYVLSMSGSRLQTLRETATNKFAVNELALSDKDQSTLNDLRKRAGALIVSAANDRGVFSRTAQFIIYNEVNWSKWKAGSCKPFELPPADGLVDEMQAAAREFLAVQGIEFPANTAHAMGTKRLDELWQIKVGPQDLRGLGNEVRGIDLLAAMNRLDIYCREDSDYELLTASEQVRADLLQWRALRSAIQDNMFRKVNPSSKSLAALREEVFAQNMSENHTEVENTPMEVEG